MSLEGVTLVTSLHTLSRCPRCLNLVAGESEPEIHFHQLREWVCSRSW